MDLKGLKETPVISDLKAKPDLRESKDPKETKVIRAM